MKSAVDNKPPQQFSHIGGNNSKKLSADKGASRAAACGATCARACAGPNCVVPGCQRACGSQTLIAALTLPCRSTRSSAS